MFGIIDGNGKMMLSDALSISSIVFIVLVLIAFYLLRAFGLSTMARNSQEKNINKISYFAFIPFLWVYLACKLAGNISFFGFRVKNFTMIISIVFIVSGLFNLVYNICGYYPLVKYIFEGNPVFINLLDYNSPNAYYFNDLFVLEKDLGINVSSTLIQVLNAMSIIFSLLQYIAEIGMIFVYVELFRKYWPRHVWAGSIFSIFGLFPVFVFVVRKNKPVKYSDYVYTQYRNIYGANNQNPNTNYDNNANIDPFADYDKNYNSHGANANSGEEDPFSEFSDKNK